jgi:hypothetical protein
MGHPSFAWLFLPSTCLRQVEGENDTAVPTRKKILLRTPPRHYGFMVGRSKISLTNEVGAWVTNIETTWATSSG